MNDHRIYDRLSIVTDSSVDVPFEENGIRFPDGMILFIEDDNLQIRKGSHTKSFFTKTVSKNPLVSDNVLFGSTGVSGTAMGILAIGTKVFSNVSGSNFQSVFLGDRVAEGLDSSLISVGNVGIGSEVLCNSKNLSDVVCIGAHSGNNINGARSILLGSSVASEASGSLSDDVLIGTKAGSKRIFEKSQSVFIGKNSGLIGKGEENVGIGRYSSSSNQGSFNVSIGTSAGQFMTGDSNVTLGYHSGVSLSGSDNVSIGTSAGYGVSGSRNIILGRSSVIGHSLDSSVLIGANISSKGTMNIIIGESAGSQGTSNGDIFIGSFAGGGQFLDGGKNLLFIGTKAGFGNSSEPVDTSSTVCIGHSAGFSEEQAFSNSVMIGNDAGSFAGIVKDSVFIGNEAGVGSNGNRNIFIGSECGISSSGSNNIWIGKSLQRSLDNVLILGEHLSSKDGNVRLGYPIAEWPDAKGSLTFPQSNLPTYIPSDCLVLTSDGKDLFASSEGTNMNLSVPYRKLVRGAFSNVSFSIHPPSIVTLKILSDDGQLFSVGTCAVTSSKTIVPGDLPFTVERGRFSCSATGSGTVFIESTNIIRY